MDLMTRDNVKRQRRNLFLGEILRGPEHTALPFSDAVSLWLTVRDLHFFREAEPPNPFKVSSSGKASLTAT